MKIAIILMLSLFMQSCMISFKKNSTPAKNPPPSAKIIEFQQVDGDKNGVISEEEVKAYNKLEKAKKSEPDIYTPLMFLVIIAGLIILICAGPRLYIFILRLFKNK
jgi:hypothetical protein